MPSKKSAKRSSRFPFVSRISKPRTETAATSTSKEQMRMAPPKYLQVLATLFFVIWILVGLFFLAFIYGNFKQGAFKALFAKRSTQAPTQVDAPTETTLPGIGKVNISCVQALGNETIQKILSSGTKDLTSEEKTKFEPCIVEKEEAAPSISPSPNQ